MQTITTIGLDIAKPAFQVHSVDAADQVVIRRQLKRRYALTFFQKSPPCLIGVEELLHVVADPADNRVPAIARGSRLKWNERLG